MGWQHTSCLTQAMFELLTIGVVQVTPHTFAHRHTYKTYICIHMLYTYCSRQYIYTFIDIRSSMTKAGLKFSTIVQNIQSVTRV